MEDEFEPTWQVLYENGSSRKNKDATKRFWLTLSQEQRHLAFLNITRKWRENGFLQYDPIRAIKENIRKHQMVGPTNLNCTVRGGRMMNTGKAEIAYYNGSWGVYSLEDIKMFNLVTKNKYGKSDI